MDGILPDPQQQSERCLPCELAEAAREWMQAHAVRVKAAREEAERKRQALRNNNGKH